jgi:hypothetical protein
MISGLPPGTKQVFVPHKDMEQGETYIFIPEDDIIIGVRIAVTKVSKLVNPDNTPVKDTSGNNAYTFQTSNIVRLLTREEYNAIKGQGRE